jgi:hypothetical protein
MNQTSSIDRCPACGRKATSQTYQSTKDGVTKTVTQIVCSSRIRKFVDTSHLRRSKKPNPGCPVQYVEVNHGS